MFLLVSVRHVGAHTSGQQHGVSIRISINLGISSDISYTEYSSDLNLGEGLCIFTSFHFPDFGLYLLNGFDFYFDLFWMVWHWKPAIYFTQNVSYIADVCKPAGHILMVHATRQAIRAKIGLKLRKYARHTAATSSLCGIKKKTSIFSIGWMVPRAGLG